MEERRIWKRTKQEERKRYGWRVRSTGIIYGYRKDERKHTEREREKRREERRPKLGEAAPGTK